ncbi:MAG: hypothetical protein ABI091_16280 [Ferruginibacter sp.]
MNKPYKVTYKVFSYERLQKINFHGKLTYPIYVQVTFGRRNIIFKSYYFDLFSKPKYSRIFHGKIYGPKIKDIIEIENELIKFIIDKHPDDFSLDFFKKEYAFYSRDLCDLTEEGFKDYLFTYFNDAGLYSFADIIKNGSKDKNLYELLEDMRTLFKINIYEDLIENSFYYAPPYYPLMKFVNQTKKWPLRYFSFREWEDKKLQNDFNYFIANDFKKFNYQNLVDKIKMFFSRK